MTNKNIPKIYKTFIQEMKVMEFKSVFGLLKYTDLNIWNHLELNKNKQLNSDKRLMNYYIILIKMIMSSEEYKNLFKSVYKNENYNTLINRLNDENYHSFVFILEKTKLLKQLLK